MAYTILFLLVAILVLVVLIFGTAPPEFTMRWFWVAALIGLIGILFAIYLMSLIARGGVV